MNAKVDPQKVEEYYSRKVLEHGATPLGVDWNSEETQKLRFDLLTGIIPSGESTVVDYGCGYGAYFEHLRQMRPEARYIGVDVSEAMLAEARRKFGSDATWTKELPTVPYSHAICSGTFNVKLSHGNDEWWDYIVSELDRLWSGVTHGLAFNLLTSHFDPGFDRPHLYYADPARVLDFCLRRYSRKILLRHDYRLYEFTVHILKEAR